MLFVLYIFSVTVRIPDDEFFDDDEDILHSPGSMHDIMSNDFDDDYGHPNAQNRYSEKQEARFYDDPVC